MQCLPPARHDFLTSLEGEATIAIGTPTGSSEPLRRVLDAAHPQVARLLI